MRPDMLLLCLLPAACATWVTGKVRTMFSCKRCDYELSRNLWMMKLSKSFQSASTQSSQL